MKRSLTTALAALLMAATLFAGGIVHNTNQSAMYTRMGNRAATLGIDAVYYNPAGLTKLADGFHFSINNQSIGQTRTVTSNYPSLNNAYRDPSNNKEYIGKVTAPIYPGIYGVLKLGNWAFSVGFNPQGGGGTATFDDGLPSFEYPISDMPQILSAMGAPVGAYRLNSFFDASSVFYGVQANVSYAINDMISVALGARYVTAKEKYSGYLKGIDINFGGTTWMPAYPPTAAAEASAAVQADVAGGAGLMDPLTNLTAIYTLMYLQQDPTGMTNAVAIGTLDVIGPLSGMDPRVAPLADQNVEAEKSAGGITPIVSVNIQPIDMLNIAVKYEHKTALELTTSVAHDSLRGRIGENEYLYTDEEKTNLDIPAYLSLGATLRPIEPLLIAGYYGYFFEKSANWDGREELLESNSWELGLGLEYSLSEKFLVSAGWLMTHSGASIEYQRDDSHALSSQGVNVGLAYDILPSIQVNLGGQYVKYTDAENIFPHVPALPGAPEIQVVETLQRHAWVVGVGVNITLASGGN